MVDTSRIADPLRRAAEAGDVPGVVADVTRHGTYVVER
jgi:hypothetical protein